MPNNRQTTEQQRAKGAWENVEGVNESKGKEYGSWARKLPSLIQTNGLGQALAFLKAKGKGDRSSHYTMLYNHVSTWVCKHLKPTETPNDLLEWVITQNSGNYRRATNETLAYALWLRRFAEAKGWSGDEGNEK